MSAPKFLDMPRFIGRGYPFSIIISARRVGKTYGTIEHMHDHGWRPLYLRYTEVELDVATSARGNPFKEFNTERGTSYAIEKGGKLRGITDGEKEIGYAASLSTFSRVRGADFTDVDKIFFDEFCPPPEAVRMRGEYDAFANMYDTVNSNRELKGKPPVQLLAYSNAIALHSALLAGMRLIGPIERMITSGREYWSDDRRGVIVWLPQKINVTDLRRDTALYRMTGCDDAIARQNLDNIFTRDSFYNVGSRPLREYTPVWAYDDLYAYRHKSGSELYICRSRADCQHFSGDTLETWKRFILPYLREDIESGRVTFCDYTAKVKIYNLCRLRLTNA